LRRTLVALLLCAAACERRTAAPALAGDRAALIANVPPTDEVVATVDDRPITTADVLAQEGTAGVDAKQALDQLIDAEVLAGLAVDRGLLNDPDVVDARKAAEARRLLTVDFAPRVTVDKVPEAEQRKAYEKNKLRYDHPDAVEAWHIVASGPATDPVQRERARQRILALEPAARAATTDEAFTTLAAPHAGEMPLRAENLTFPLHGVVEDAFAEAAFRLKKPGDVSPITETSYGFHLIRLVRKLPEEHKPLDAVRDELRPVILPSWQKVEFERYVRGLVAQSSVQTFPDRLATDEAGGK
jgi:parvulin-like peptidyl-prolyl isomerase